VKLHHLLDPRPMLRRAAARARVAGGGRKKINLALQGGGAHGAFTWGVIDHILDDGRLAIEGISGASAGAVNAVMLADGLARGGPDEAKKRLAEFWRAASLGGDLPALQRAVVERLFSFLPLEGSPVAAWFDALSRYLSPYDLNPLNINPLKELIERFVDFDAVRKSQLALFVSATNVHTGRLRIFPRETITADVIMASACLPFLFRAVEIDGEPYWDGGYSGNPTLTPLIRESDAQDTILVQINPRERLEPPRTANEILNRLNEISFNSPLMKELRMIALLRQAADPGSGEGARWAKMRTHRIKSDMLAKFGASSKLNAEWEFVSMLRSEGRQAAEAFLGEHGADIGQRSTADLDVLLSEC
jgi:NTE family protein